MLRPRPRGPTTSITATSLRLGLSPTIASSPKPGSPRNRGAAMTRFGGKHAAITGAASGLGREVALEMAREGIAGLFLMDRDHDGLNETAAVTRFSGAARIATETLDVADAAAMRAAAGSARQAF